ncbi:hypothetical protein ElyMa_003353800 [Elysia marginata]|uniref:PiggyBac transposable element-derived protein domain-containing protein n=1 Tax=Elysia marginata TaxID=1093978 RepID=A0AAV4JGZ8_9GAST|nr:hypothetical protein ElyMa_003353800 [Elysia marginata]
MQICLDETSTSVVPLNNVYVNIIESSRFFALRTPSGGRSPQRRKSKMADGLTWPVRQSFAVKSTLPVGVITSYVIVVAAKGL